MVSPEKIWLTIAGTATDFSLRLRLHYKSARAAGVMFKKVGLKWQEFEYILTMTY